MVTTILWSDKQWEIFFNLANFLKILIIKEILSGNNPLKTLKWVVESTSNYSIIIMEN